ncbi:type IV toxin-antitoxin system AbiEi family antitoxin [Pararhizobium sp. YC-54]|uniref:type IV toxin-antitoxin system AbiEi family antitoxin n=1 Tax=Pararhizobium sp. YC-54 TaxID=2986920 RepID=UPI0021F7A714|nr:type IV toxin-antitoxin system AbiEi family antitoxin [Pararhizobium sp. YC-54]MCW0001538.1 type IV toxin-antitoxin system AbiEi family antitoxin [Pararhizobium sp. YC-54]
MNDDLEIRAADAIKALLERVPVIKVEKIELTPPRFSVDILAELTMDGNRRLLACEVKPIGQPRHVRAALLQLRKASVQFDPPATPIFIAPYLSPEAQALCREFDVGYLDLVGNAWLAFDTVFIERFVDTKPPAVQRSLKSVFKPKSAQVLRVLLREPDRAWRVADLAHAADVSLGHVSNVRNELVDREWAEITDEGLRLSQPDELLSTWHDAYEAPAGERLAFYTTLHGTSFDIAARSALNADPGSSRAMFASFSAAHWLAPYGRVATQYFYADADGLEQLRKALKLSPATSGSNVVITVLKEHGLFNDAVEPAPNAVCTSPVQTYLDLAIAGEWGGEAAGHLRKEVLTWRGDTKVMNLSDI